MSAWVYGLCIMCCEQWSFPLFVPNLYSIKPQQQSPHGADKLKCLKKKKYSTDLALHSHDIVELALRS